MTPQRIIYLDNNATTACAPEVVAAMLPYFAEQFGNASSVHLAGRQAFRAVEDAREIIASLLSVKPHEMFFNSGATEGNNWIFHAFAQSTPADRRRVVVSSIEHKSVLDCAIRLRHFGFDVQLLPVTSEGVVDLAQSVSLITSETALVSVQYANNETGVIQPIAELAELTHAVGAFFHCDAVQGLGKAHLDLSSLPVDSAVFSAHKVHGPKGVGALFIRGGARNWRHEFPVVGGGQEHSIRPGTLNVSGIVGFGRAAELIQSNLALDLQNIQTLRDSLESQLQMRIHNCLIHGANVHRIPNTTNVFIPGVLAQMLVSSLQNICISEGSACASGTVTGSHVLKAMLVDPVILENSVRISMSRYTAPSDIDILLDEIQNVIHNLKREGALNG
jgi:cysteine desulfurase